tara:strand:+ start:4955 stop:7135 length:2181 start_codon:yes stop_codon:yes gene_type:complete
MDEDQNNIDINSLFARVAEAESIAQSALDMVDGLEKTVKANELRGNTLTELIDDQVATIEALKESLTTNTESITKNQELIKDLSETVEAEKQERKLLFDLQEDRRLEDQDTLQKQQRTQELQGGGTGGGGGQGGAAGGGTGGQRSAGGTGGGIGGILGGLGVGAGLVGLGGISGNRGPLGALGGTLDFLTGGVTDADRRGGDPNFIGKAFGGTLDILTGQKFDFDQQGDSAVVGALNPLSALTGGLDLLNPKVRKRMKELKETQGLTGTEALREAKKELDFDRFEIRRKKFFEGKKSKKEKKKEENNRDTGFEMMRGNVFNEEKGESKDKGLFGGLFNFGKKEKNIDEEDVKPEKKKGLFGGLFGFNKGGEVEDNDKDTSNNDKDSVPALLTPGEFVIKKDAVEKVGVETLQGINAAAGGDGKGGPTKVQFTGEQGYRFGQVNPESIMLTTEKFTSKETFDEETGETIDRSSSYKEEIVDVAIEDLQEHQKQIVSEIQKIPGYEKINIIDIIERVRTGQGRLAKMPQEQLMNILKNSDAYKATEAKKEAAIEADRELGPNRIVEGFSEGGLVGEDIQTNIKEVAEKIKPRLQKMAESLRMDENKNVDFTSLLGKERGEKMNQTFSGFMGIIQNDVIPIVETLKSNSKNIQPSPEDTRESEFGDVMDPLEEEQPPVPQEVPDVPENPPLPEPLEVTEESDALGVEISETEHLMPFIELIKNRSIQVR